MKTFIVLILFLFSTLSFADTLTMSKFREMHRQDLLSNFKTLYKQRHITAHKANLRHKYKRVKKVSHQNLRTHTHSRTQMPETPPAMMQTEANKHLEFSKEHGKREIGNIPRPFLNEPNFTETPELINTQFTMPTESIDEKKQINPEIPTITKIDRPQEQEMPTTVQSITTTSTITEIDKPKEQQREEVDTTHAIPTNNENINETQRPRPRFANPWSRK